MNKKLLLTIFALFLFSPLFAPVSLAKQIIFEGPRSYNVSDNLLLGGITSSTYVASTTWTAPITETITVEAWGGGGGGGGQNLASDGGGGGGGGAYAKKLVPVVKDTVYIVSVGTNGVGGSGTCGTNGGDSWFSTSTLVIAKGGTKGCNSTGTPPAGGAGGASSTSIGDTKFGGGTGEKGKNNASGVGGYGGSSAGIASEGQSGPQTWVEAAYPTSSTPTGAGHGGNGGAATVNGAAPVSGNGGGGGGSGEGSPKVGGDGTVGKIILTYDPPSQFQVDTGGTLLTSLVSYWKLDSSETDFFDSQNWTNNNSTPYTTGILGNAVSLANNNTKTLSRTTPISSSTTNWSIALWIWLPDTSEQGFFISNGVNTDLSAGYSLSVGAAGNINSAGNRLFFSLGNVVDKDSGTDIGTGWHHLILLRSSADGIVRAYIDGTQTANTHTAAIVAPNGQSKIGGVYGGYSASLTARVDEVGIWNKALSSTEISDLYNSGNGQTMCETGVDCPVATARHKSPMIINLAPTENFKSQHIG